MKIALHICCGICAAAVVEKLTIEGHHVSGFFYNPNISTWEEYGRRLDVARTVCNQLGIPIEVPPYDHGEWTKVAGALHAEPEDGRRCEVCYRLRLSRTFEYMKSGCTDVMTTTLTISPKKRASVINGIGSDLAGDRFITRDFKKQDGTRRSVELARIWGLYRQHYCGCEYSLRA